MISDPVTKGRRAVGGIFWAIFALYSAVVTVSAVLGGWH